MNKYRKNIYSQNGEDGIIEEVMQRLHIAKGLACEFGAHDGYWLSNTRNLIDKGWDYLHLEASNGQTVTPENVNELVPQKLQLLSIDIDGNDYEVWKAYTGKADCVVIEINSGLNPLVEQFHETTGASFITMLRLGKAKGYFLLWHTGNMIFLLKKYKKYFPEAQVKDIEKFDSSFML